MQWKPCVWTQCWMVESKETNRAGAWSSRERERDPLASTSPLSSAEQVQFVGSQEWAEHRSIKEVRSKRSSKPPATENRDRTTHTARALTHLQCILK